MEKSGQWHGYKILIMTKDLQQITKQFLTYNTKTDPINLDQRFLILGTLNVLINDQEKFSTREGITLQSLAGTTNTAIEGSTDWENSDADDFSLRAFLDAVDSLTGNLEVFINGVWETLMSSITSVALIFDPYWDDTEKIDRLLWCDGSPNLYDWSGASAKVSAITATTITLQDTDTFGQHRFLTTGTRAIRIKDDNGTWHRTGYSGGEATTTLTGLDTDLTAFPFSGGNLIVQEVIIHSNIPDANFSVDFIKVIDNQVWAGSRTSNLDYVSKNTDITDYTFSTPRAVGEGALLTLDGPGRAIGVLRGDVILFAGKNFIYKSVFNQITVGGTLAETIKVERLKTTALQSAQHQNLLENFGNGLIWIGQDNVLYELLDATLAYNPDLRPLSDPLKPDFDAADFTGGHLKFFKTRLHISAPNSSRNFIYEFRLDEKLQKIWFWQPPQTYPVKRFSIITNVLCGHSSATNETYILFEGTNDNGQAIHNIAILAGWSGNIRDLLKNASEMFHEGDITENTTLSVAYLFTKDGGGLETINKIINGSNSDLLFPNSQDVSLGNLPLGDSSLSGDDIEEDPAKHFRVSVDTNVEEFFDYTTIFETNDIDYRWGISSTGSDATLSSGKITGSKNNN